MGIGLWSVLSQIHTAILEWLTDFLGLLQGLRNNWILEHGHLAGNQRTSLSKWMKC